MAIGITTDPFKPTGSISFGDIAARYGKSARNVKASSYLRDDSDLGDDTTKLVKDATENSAVATSTDDTWSVGDLRNTIKNYNVTHTGTSEVFDATSDVNWNDNLNKNISKKFNLNDGSTVYSNEVDEDALSFNADMRNLTISIAGDIYGASGASGGPNEDGGDGGDALYVNNSYSEGSSNVKIQINTNGRIRPGGGGGGGGGDGANKTLDCDSYEDVSFHAVTYEGDASNARTISIQRESYGKWSYHCTGNAASGFGNRPAFRTSGTPNEVNYVIANAGAGFRTRKRCRGSTYRRSRSAYTCYTRWNVTCKGTFDDTLTATGGDGAVGGRGVGYYDGSFIDSTQIGGLSGGSGETIECVNKGTKVTSDDGGDGGDGGTFGQKGQDGGDGIGKGIGGAGGKSILYKNVNIIGKNDTTVKGSIFELS